MQQIKCYHWSLKLTTEDFELMPTPLPPQLTLSTRQRSILQSMASSRTIPYRLVLRAKIILAMDEGNNNLQIARHFHINRETVRDWRATWLSNFEKLQHSEVESDDDKPLARLIQDILADKPRSGAPATFTPEQICQIIALACEHPTDSLRPISQWTPRELADEVIKRNIVDSISVRSVGRFLKSGGLETAQGRVLAQCQSR